MSELGFRVTVKYSRTYHPNAYPDMEKSHAAVVLNDRDRTLIETITTLIQGNVVMKDTQTLINGLDVKIDRLPRIGAPGRGSASKQGFVVLSSFDITIEPVIVFGPRCFLLGPEI